MKADPASGARAIEVTNLTKRYGELVAVDGVSFCVPAGEIFGLLGPNGAGKTSIIRMLTGLSQPSAGRAAIFGLDVRANSRAVKKLFGLVPETSNLYDELSTLENVLFMAQLFGVPPRERERRAGELLDLFGLDAKKHARFSSLSRGMKRATAIAAALVHRPRLLFLDEPTAGLDVIHARALRSLVRRLNQEGVTVFLTTHYLEEADQLCDRVALLVKGRIVALDTPEGLKEQARADTAIGVSFEPLPEQAASDLAQRAGVRSVTADGNGLRLHGSSVPDLLGTALAYASEKGVRITHVNTVKPTLEEAFVKLTGLSSDVMKAEKGAAR